MNESQLRVAVASFNGSRHLPDGDAKSDQWLAQVCSLYVRGSISVTETIAVTFEVDL